MRQMRWVNLCASVLLCACISLPTTRTVEDGKTLSFAEMEGHRGSLREWVHERLRSGDLAAGFYALEFYKSLEILAFEPVDPSGERLAVASSSTPAADGERGSDSSRAIVLPVAPTLRAIQATEPQGQRSDRFWEEQRLVEARLTAIQAFGMSQAILTDLYRVQSLQEIQRQHQNDELTGSFFLADDRVYLLWLRRDDHGLLELDTPASVVFEATAKLLAALRNPKTSEWEARSSALYEILFANLKDQLQEVRRLNVVPDGFLANIPFGVLRDPDGALLTDRMGVRHLPAASFGVAAAPQRKKLRPPRALVVGNPDFPEGFASLPLAEREARAVSRVFEDSTLLRGPLATEQRVVDALESHNVLHLATHGYLSPLGQGGSSLLFAQDRDEDGLWESSEIASTDLSHAYLAVLSACETSVSTADSRSLSGITAAFLAAGAPTVIGSLWQVSDDATSVWMVRFYERFLELGALDALRAAQNDLRRDERYRHPYYWAAFVLYGDAT